MATRSRTRTEASALAGLPPRIGRPHESSFCYLGSLHTQSDGSCRRAGLQVATAVGFLVLALSITQEHTPRANTHALGTAGLDEGESSHGKRAEARDFCRYREETKTIAWQCCEVGHMLHDRNFAFKESTVNRPA